MSMPLAGYQRLLISDAARIETHGAALVAAFSEAGLPILEFADDLKAQNHPTAVKSGSLLALYAPPSGWISKAEHGNLSVRPDEHYLHPIIGCRSACSYCYLQTNAHGRLPMRFHVGIDSLIRAIEDYIERIGSDKTTILFCTGELADSLADIELFPIAPALIKYFMNHAQVKIEFRSKSNRVQPLLVWENVGNVVIAFSLSPGLHILRYESGTATLEERLAAARLCQNVGYSIALNFEPLILTPDWQTCYQQMLTLILSYLKIDSLDHVSIGCLRWSERLGQSPVFKRYYGGLSVENEVIEYRSGKFNGTAGFTGRLLAYKWMATSLRRYGLKSPIWWSLETPEMLENLNGL